MINIGLVDIIIISTYHNQLSKIVAYASKKGKHILVEKPAATNLIDLKINIDIQKNTKIRSELVLIIDTTMQ